MINAHSLQVLEGTLGALSSEMAPALFQHTMALVDLPTAGLGYEQGILDGALTSRDEAEIRRAMDLYQRPGRLFFALAPQAERLSAALRVEAVPSEETAARPEDLSAALAWSRMTQGATTLFERTALFDPIGDLAVAVRFLDQRGLAARWVHEKRRGNPHWMPPPSFALLGQGETPEALERYNRGDTKRLGHVAFDFDPALQTVVPPRVYAELLRAAAGLQFVIPASHVLDFYFTRDWARSLPDNAVVATGIKGFSEGKTVREYIDSVFEKVGRGGSSVGIFGYMPATRWMQEQRGERPKSDGWNVLLTDPSLVNGMHLAMRWAGPEATMNSVHVGGPPVIVVENPNFDPPLRITILGDDQVIRANELASVYKNLQALHLGQALFEKMRESVMKGERWSHALQAGFLSFYQGSMDQAKRDILDALEVEGIPAPKRILMPDIEDDMYGSWGTDQFKEMYKLVWQIFHPDSTAEHWQEGMPLLKLRIRDYYSVRNPCYGFCLAADEAAVAAQRWLSLQDVKDAAARLRSHGLLVNAKGAPFSGQEVIDKLELNADPETHYFFSMIPAGLRPEALQIAEQLPVRYGKTSIARLPESFRRAHLSVERIQHKILFDPRIYRDIVELTKTLAHVFEESPESGRERYGQLLGQLLDLLRAATKSAAANERALGNKRRSETIILMRRLVANLEPFVKRVVTNTRLTPQHIVWLNQAVIEALTAMNLFYILPPEERQREVRHLLDRTTRLSELVDPRADFEFSALFPTEAVESPLSLGSGARLSHLRDHIYAEVRIGLTELTYRMNMKLHEEDRAIVRKDITTAVLQMEKAVTGLAMKMKDDPEISAFVVGLQDLLRGIHEKVNSKKLNPKDRLLVFQSFIEALIHTRRFLVFPDDRAPVEFRYTMQRFEKISDFLAGSVKTPLWNYGNGQLTPPPPPAQG